MTRALKMLLRDLRGTAVVELALIAPVLIVVIIGVIDVSIAYGHKLELEQAVQRSIEKVMQTTGEDTVEGTIKEEVLCQYNGVDNNGDCETDRIVADDVTVEFRLECNNVVTPWDDDCPNGQVEARYIRATAVDTYMPMFPIAFGSGPNGSYAMSVTAGVRVS